MSTQIVMNDVLYGPVRLSDLEMAFVDHPLFQRLASLRQLSLVHRVYKGANHTRKDHSIGTAHLAEVWLRHLGVWDERRAKLVKLGALLHDIGHAAFSHTFDHYFAAKLGLPCHEKRSVELMRRINAHCKQLSDEEETFVEHVILGTPLPGLPAFWFELVANLETGIDVDKMDYLQRDAYFCGVRVAFQPMRIIYGSRITVDGHIAFRDKIYMSLFHMCQMRFYMHREVYQHPTVLVLERMLVDALVHFPWTMHDWTLWNDEAVLFTVRTYPDPKLGKGRTLLDRMDHRVLYKVANDAIGSNNVDTANAPLPTIPESTDEESSGYWIKGVHKFGSTSSPNPLDKVRFYRKGSEAIIYMKPSEVSPCLPIQFVEEHSIRLLERLVSN